MSIRELWGNRKPPEGVDEEFLSDWQDYSDGFNQDPGSERFGVTIQVRARGKPRERQIQPGSTNRGGKPVPVRRPRVTDLFAGCQGGEEIFIAVRNRPPGVHAQDFPEITLEELEERHDQANAGRRSLRTVRKQKGGASAGYRDPEEIEPGVIPTTGSLKREGAFKKSENQQTNVE